MIVWFLLVAEAYFVAGALFAVYFVVAGVERLDKAARGSSIWFRLLILPGSIALWPYLLLRLLGGQESPRVERNSHREAALERAK
ncbi:MAG: hypothetical protein ABI882_12605 [Acidobacteriota bacterium]